MNLFIIIKLFYKFPATTVVRFKKVLKMIIKNSTSMDRVVF